ncbi:MAG: hypothetical protein ACE5GA_03320 [Candidatus Zixiibacteriota bacterium]
MTDDRAAGRIYNVGSVEALSYNSRIRMSSFMLFFLWCGAELREC